MDDIWHNDYFFLSCFVDVSFNNMQCSSQILEHILVFNLCSISKKCCFTCVIEVALNCLTKNLHFSFEGLLCLTLVEMDFTIFQSKALLSSHPCIKMLETINELFVNIIVLWEDIIKKILGF
jgi:hypothetical protein